MSVLAPLRRLKELVPGAAWRIRRRGPRSALGDLCLNAPARGGGQVDVSDALNLTTDCGRSHAAVGYEGYDETTSLFDNESAACFQ